MLTLQEFFPQGCRMIGKRLQSWQLPVVLLSGLACVAPSDSVAQQGPVYTQDSPDQATRGAALLESGRHALPFCGRSPIPGGIL